MDNANSPRDGGAYDHTQPLSMGSGGGSGSAASDQQGSDYPQPRRRGYGRTTRWVAGLGLAALVIGGGAILGTQLTGSAGAAPVRTSLASDSAPTGAGSAALSAMLGMPASVSSDTATAFSGQAAGSVRRDLAGLRHCLAVARHLRRTGHPAAARAKLRACVRRYHLRHLRLLALRLLGGEHGQITFRAKHGTRTIAFERGVIQSVSGSTVVVKAKDGTTWTWDLIGKTVVIRAGHRAAASALAAKERVFVVGPVVSGANDARLIIIRR